MTEQINSNSERRFKRGDRIRLKVRLSGGWKGCGIVVHDQQGELVWFAKEMDNPSHWLYGRNCVCSHEVALTVDWDMNATRNAWKNLRLGVLEIYGPLCMKCGASNRRIDVDHIKPKSLFPELALTFENMQVLCEICNQEKGVKSQIDYRSVELVIVGRQKWDRMCRVRWGRTFEEHLADVAAGLWGCKSKKIESMATN